MSAACQLGVACSWLFAETNLAIEIGDLVGRAAGRH